MPPSVLTARYICHPRRAKDVRYWLEREKNSGQRLSWIEVTGTELHSFILHGAHTALSRFRSDAINLGAKIA